MVEYCPFCRVYQRASRTIVRRKKKRKVVEIVNYHCERCGSFIRSEEDRDGSILDELDSLLAKMKALKKR